MIWAALLLLQGTSDVFVSGQEGYHSFRIPSVIVSEKGTVLAFCEGRKKSRSDTGDIDLVLKRSTDGGATWGPLQVVWDDGPNTCGNPCAVVGKWWGKIFLLMTHNLAEDVESKIIDGTSKGTRTVWVSISEDDGLTWSKPRDLTRDVKKPEWTWTATGPGVGIQTRNGRLVIPCDHVEAGTKKGGSHVILSDDAGNSWKLGGALTGGVNECQVVERRDGSLLLNMRNYGTPERERASATSNDQGMTWSDLSRDPALIEPACQASLLSAPGTPGRILFSNPADRKSRIRMTVKVSVDNGITWPVAKELTPGPAAYSCLTTLPEGRFGCLFETGEKSAYEKIVFARFHLD